MDLDGIPCIVRPGNRKHLPGKQLLKHGGEVRRFAIAIVLSLRIFWQRRRRRKFCRSQEWRFSRQLSGKHSHLLLHACNSFAHVPCIAGHQILWTMFCPNRGHTVRKLGHVCIRRQIFEYLAL